MEGGPGSWKEALAHGRSLIVSDAGGRAGFRDTSLHGQLYHCPDRYLNHFKKLGAVEVKAQFTYNKKGKGKPVKDTLLSSTPSDATRMVKDDLHSVSVNFSLIIDGSFKFGGVSLHKTCKTAAGYLQTHSIVHSIRWLGSGGLTERHGDDHLCNGWSRLQ